MLAMTTIELPATLELDVTLTLQVAKTMRVTEELLHQQQSAGPQLDLMRRAIAADVIGNDLAEEWRDATRELTRDLEAARLALVTMTQDRDRLVRVVDKLTGA